MSGDRLALALVGHKGAPLTHLYASWSPVPPQASLVVFDKTGTLTTGKAQVTDLVLLQPDGALLAAQAGTGTAGGPLPLGDDAGRLAADVEVRQQLDPTHMLSGDGALLRMTWWAGR